jgi:hypothetical protein
MKSKEEIELMLLETMKEHDYVVEWANNAYLKYKKEQEYYGLEADRGELDTAYDAQKVLGEKINVLNWVLGK